MLESSFTATLIRDRSAPLGRQEARDEINGLTADPKRRSSLASSLAPSDGATLSVASQPSMRPLATRNEFALGRAMWLTRIGE